MVREGKIQRFKGLLLIFGLAGVLALAGLALAPEAWAGTPCCAIVSIKARTGLVTAKEVATGKTFRFEVKDKALLKTLKVGQDVYADFKGMKVSLKPAGATPCCTIVSIAAPGRAKVQPASPENGIITGIDAATGRVTAKTAAGRVFQFEVKDQALLKGLKVGQDVYADFKGMQVSLKPAGGGPCCGIVGAAAGGAVR